MLYVSRAHAGGTHYLRALHVNRFWVFMRPKCALSRRPSRHFELRDLKVIYSSARAQLKLALEVICSDPCPGTVESRCQAEPLGRFPTARRAPSGCYDRWLRFELRQRIEIGQLESDAAAGSDGTRTAGLANKRIRRTMIEG
jgi:hypothetical protein